MFQYSHLRFPVDHNFLLQQDNYDMSPKVQNNSYELKKSHFEQILRHLVSAKNIMMKNAICCDNSSTPVVWPSTACVQTPEMNECIRLLKDVRFFDVLRADKTTSGAGLEVRVPYFDKEFIKNRMLTILFLN